VAVFCIGFAKITHMKTTFELTKTDLEEAVTDYINKVLEPNVRYETDQLNINFTMDEAGATATAQVVDSPDDDDKTF
jgi:hypothetical protein